MLFSVCDVDVNKIFTTLSVTQRVFDTVCDGGGEGLLWLFENHYYSRISVTITLIIFKILRCCLCLVLSSILTYRIIKLNTWWCAAIFSNLIVINQSSPSTKPNKTQ